MVDCGRTCLVSQSSNFKLNSRLNWKPVKFVKQTLGRRMPVIERQSSRKVLHML